MPPSGHAPHKPKVLAKEMELGPHAQLLRQLGMRLGGYFLHSPAMSGHPSIS